MRNLRAVWTKYERGVYDEDEVLDKTGRILYHTGVMQEEYVAEGFEAEMDIDSIDPNDVYMIDKDEIVDWFVNRERKIMKDSSKEDVLGIWADYSDPDDDEYDEVESMNKDDIIQIYLFNYRDGLEGNDEEELQNRLADELEFGAEYDWRGWDESGGNTIKKYQRFGWDIVKTEYWKHPDLILTKESYYEVRKIMEDGTQIDEEITYTKNVFGEGYIWRGYQFDNLKSVLSFIDEKTEC